MFQLKKNKKEIILIQELISKGKKLLEENKTEIDVPIMTIYHTEDPADYCNEYQITIADINSWKNECERAFHQIYSGKYLTVICEDFNSQNSRLENKWDYLIDSLRRKINFLETLIDELKKGYKKSEKELIENRMKSYLISFICPLSLLIGWLVLQFNEINIHFSLPQTISVLSASYFITLSFIEKDEKRLKIISSLISFLPMIIEFLI